jgi:uridine kinase
MVRIVGVGGGSGSGKTTVVARIRDIVPELLCLSQDNYYRSADNVTNETITAFNFDHPDAFDNELIETHLTRLKAGETIEVPTYDFVNHRRAARIIKVEPQKLVIFEGIMIYSKKAIRDLIDLKLYVDTPDDIRFIRRLKRDIEERGRTVESVVRQYTEYVRPGHFQFVEPTKSYADLIIPEGGHNENALEVLISFIRGVLG